MVLWLELLEGYYMSIFRAYDIRGVYPGELNEDIAYRVGLAFGRLIGKGKIAIARDARKSGPGLHESVVRGLLESGMDVMDIGAVPTPVLYFIVNKENLEGGVVITGSHNPKEYNGIKLCGKGGLCLTYENGINEIEDMVKEGVEGGKREGNLVKRDAGKDYLDFVVRNVKFRRPLKIVIDAGNGIAGRIVCDMFRKLGCEVIGLFCEPDGDFPNHHPDPLVSENLKMLRMKVRGTKADVGIAYDGDGDRVGFVDEKGKIVPNNNAYAFLIENTLAKNHGARILYEVLTSKMVEDVIKREGGIPVISRVGHSYIQALMKEKDCALGGETSGHYYFRETNNSDDAIFASVKFAELLSTSKVPLSGMGKNLPKYITSDEKRIHCPDDKKFEVIERLKEKFKDKDSEVITIDGVKVLFRNKNSWFIVRASNTQPALVLRWEAKDNKEFERLEKLAKKEVENEIKKLS